MIKISLKVGLIYNIIMKLAKMNLKWYANKIGKFKITKDLNNGLILMIR
jgi:hypothetical protein